MENKAVYLGKDGENYRFEIDEQVYIQPASTIRIPTQSLNEGFYYTAIWHNETSFGYWKIYK